MAFGWVTNALRRTENSTFLIGNNIFALFLTILGHKARVQLNSVARHGLQRGSHAQLMKPLAKNPPPHPFQTFSLGSFTRWIREKNQNDFGDAPSDVPA